LKVSRLALGAAILGAAHLLGASHAWADPIGGARVAAAANSEGLEGSAASPSQTPTLDANGGAQRSADVTLYLTADPLHTDLIIPRSAFAHAPSLIKTVVDRTGDRPWILIGWGPYWFGLEQRGGPFHGQPWLGVNAVFTTFVPQPTSRLRVVALDAPGPAPGDTSVSMMAVRISPEGLDRAIQRINATFSVGPDGGPVASDDRGAPPGVSIYKSHEIYHLTHECNHWVSAVLRAGGIRDAALLDLVPQSLNLDLKMSGAKSVRRASTAKPSPAS